MSEKVFGTFGGNQKGVSIIGDDSGLFLKGGDILENRMRLSSTQIRTAFKVMMWDIYEALDVKVQLLIRELLIKNEQEGDIELGLLTAIGLLNIEHQIKVGSIPEIPDNVDGIYDFVQSESFEMTMLKDLFDQVNHYRTNGKLVPPEMVAIGKVEEARNKGRSSVKDLLEQNR